MRRHLLSLLAVSLVAACNEQPDPGFQKSVEDRQAASATDPYLDLSNLPRLANYSRAEDAKKPAEAVSAAAGAAGTLKAMLEKFDKDDSLGRPGALDMQCRAPLDAALSFQDAPAPAKLAEAGAERYAILGSCRDAAIAQEKRGGEAALRANVLRRLASTGMTITGMAVTAKGDPENGVKLWREGEALVVKDKPGFKMTVQSLRGW